MSTNQPKFKKGDIVRKTSGAHFWGKIVNRPFKTPLNDVWHYDVCAVHPDFFGTTHIMTEPQMELYEPRR